MEGIGLSLAGVADFAAGICFEQKIGLAQEDEVAAIGEGSDETRGWIFFDALALQRQQQWPVPL